MVEVKSEWLSSRNLLRLKWTSSVVVMMLVSTSEGQMVRFQVIFFQVFLRYDGKSFTNGYMHCKTKKDGRRSSLPTSTCHRCEAARLDWVKALLGVTSLLQIELIIAI